MTVRVAVFLLAFASLGAQPRQADFSADVQPILRAKCFACHGSQVQMNGLRLDDSASALKGGHSGAAILPGNSAGSPLIQRAASSDPKFRMPPSGGPLSPEGIAILRAWIDQGAKWPQQAQAGAAAPKNTHWAYQPIVRPEAPQVRNSAWVRNPIDAFALTRLETEGVEPSPEADRGALIRRLSLDLTGLPPTPDEVRAFLADNRPDAYERVVDRLLASPHYGEKWARPWLDLAHYADSDGYEKDQVRAYAWRYRHWLIDALNRDMPFDQFTVEQIAGDLLPNPTVEQKVATGFLRNTLTNREAGVDRGEARFEQVINRTNTFGATWLGLTVGCAQCHNHKYDAISQQEYYQFFAFFDGVMEENIDAPLASETGPYLKALPEYQKKRAKLLEAFEVPALEAEWETFLQAGLANPGQSHEWDFHLTSMRAMFDNAERVLRTPPEQRTESQKRRLTNYFINAPGPALRRDEGKLECLKDLRVRLRELDASFPALSQAQTIVEDPQAGETHLRVRGDWKRDGIKVDRAVLASLPPLASGAKPTRLTLARWVVSRENPLTPRVTVNHIWQELFGRGLVHTSEDFGVMGDKPTHPQLLDWLAAEFMDSGWSMKRLTRLIVTSAAYRQSSNVRKELLSRDPDNKLLARQTRLRLPAELVRDTALSVSGLLNPAIGGKSVRPPQPKGVAELGYGGSVKWAEDEGPERYRRGLYIHFQRTTPYPQLMTFDEPDSNVSCTRRARSNTPLQALNLLNDPVFFEASQSLAWRLEHEASGSFDDRLNLAFELCLARQPSESERERLRRYFNEERAGWSGVSRVLLNMDEFITRE